MSSGRSDLVDVELIYKRDTQSGRAFICENPNAPVKREKDVIFLPKSIVERDGHIFTMPRWLAEEKGIDNLVKE